MDQKRIKQLYNHYKNYLFGNVLPFWLKNSLDREYGGYITCLDREGKIYDTDKSIWFQGRGTWIYSKLYNTIDQKHEWLEAAKIGYDFLAKYGFDSDGRMFFKVTQEGLPLQKRRYIYSEMFAIIAFAEYFKATGNKEAFQKAIDTYDLVLDLYANPSKLLPKIIPETRVFKSHSMYMIMLSTTQLLREIDKNPKYDEISKKMTDIILEDFYKPEKGALFETVGPNGEFVDNPQGRCINPGHAIESSWFLMQEGLNRNDETIIRKALNILDCSLKIGWDKEYGGILYFVDINGKPPEQLEWDMKLWWPHTEALYALLLAHYITNDKKYETWYDKVHDYSFSHFGDEIFGEWFGYLHRDGTVSNTLKGSMWKGPFHLPRALLLNLKLLEKMNMEVEPDIHFASN